MDQLTTLMTGNKTPSIVTQHRENTIINFKLSMKKYFLTLGLLLMGILTTSAQTVGNPFVKENEEEKIITSTLSQVSVSATASEDDGTVIIPIGTEYYGDVNEDKIVNINDIVATVNFILNNSTATGIFEILNADTDKDGVVSISDVVAIVNYVLNGEKKIRVSGGNAAEAHAKKR